ncbi:MAG: hypothetical protein KIS94_13580 [Chitinophagales bacterium]|nr:hypothetical protein [Chitinophagales bacterium]
MVKKKLGSSQRAVMHLITTALYGQPRTYPATTLQLLTSTACVLAA